MNDTFLKACRGEATPYTPIWLMRQAGRYQPEYRAIREKVSFLELCKTPELACEVTVRAVDQLNVDAAIIFADILLILEPLNLDFSFTKGMGPKIHNPIRTKEHVDAVSDNIDVEALEFVMNSLRLTRKELKVPLIGFAGAPFTLASYAIEGGGSKNYFETKKIMYGDEGMWNALMSKFTNATIKYLNAQVKAGAQTLQVFDSWVGCLSKDDYKRFVKPHMKHLFDSLDKSVPSIHFGTGNPTLYPEMRDAGGDVSGVDWKVRIDEEWASFNYERPIMGNLDPGMILVPETQMKEAATSIIKQAAGRPGHIFNLGHGIMPAAKVSQVQELVRHVHEVSAR